LFRDQLKAKEEERVEIEEKYSSLQVGITIQRSARTSWEERLGLPRS
jgi:hypothetical protein